ncbi:formate dehydrogenase major subunit [Halodesulfovibrio aestuarii]|uniref:Formate dehydrogenase major subunit n=3 Tax=Halodesulfovibrio aestuarii TaxID=126333 RepID=A0A8G2FB37_9BACT|nr:formate dehydrogenase major subunit [Halodesulfovibrio aestuarii]
MTNHWIDLKNSDCVLIMGSNAAENHPISFKWVMKAKDNGATLIHVDPRFTRTSAKCDVYAPIRSGADIPFLGGLIKYILDNNKYFHDYVVNYTNASFVVGKDYTFDDGLFSGFDPKKSTYDKSKWAFEVDDKGVPVRDESLKNPRCVFNLLKKHFARYDVDTVSTVTGTPKEDILTVYKTYAASGAPDKSATIMYAMGWTQHTVGVQNIRTMAMVQLLLGNIGVAGGGVNALRGESNVQGSTDHCLLVHILPGYLGTPKSKWADLAAYNKNCTPKSADPMSANWWGNKPKYVSSFVKSMYPVASLEKGYEMLPKLDAHKPMTEYYWLSMFEKMHKGQFDGFFAWGQNPACGGANANKNREAMAELDWLVNVNIFDNETASFWRGPNMKPEDIKTEVFFLPCAVSIEKEGSVTNSGRWMQWRYRGPKPYGQTLPDGDIILKLTDKIQQLYKTEGGAYPDPIVSLGLQDWQNSHGHFDAHGIAKLINGYFMKDTEIKGKLFKKGQQVPSFAYLKDDGSTCSGNWLYCGSYTDKGNMAARRDKTQNDAQANIGLYPNWAWCWPVNRRILYNRASVDLTGKPYAPKKAVIKWTGDKTKWQGDVPDGGWKPGTKHAFIMRKHGFGQLYGPGRAEGPFPEHYEPLECPIAKNPFSSQLHNPTAFQIASEEKAVANPRFPYVGTTYRVTEHWQTGLMTRYQGWLLEAEPQLFCEISEDLAKKENIANGETVHVSSLRGKLECVAIVTKRIKPYKVHGQDVHLVGLPWHYGWVTPKNGGDSANLLTPSVGDPNTGIPETKAFMVNVSKIKRA